VKALTSLRISDPGGIVLSVVNQSLELEKNSPKSVPLYANQAIQSQALNCFLYWAL
jgi:hypothetical protein